MTNCIHEAGHAFIAASLYVNFLYIEVEGTSGRFVPDDVVKDKEWAAVGFGGPRAQLMFSPSSVPKRLRARLDESIMELSKMRGLTGFGLYISWSNDFKLLENNSRVIEGEMLCKELLSAPHAERSIKALASALSIHGRVNQDDAIRIMGLN